MGCYAERLVERLDAVNSRPRGWANCRPGGWPRRGARRDLMSRRGSTHAGTLAVGARCGGIIACGAQIPQGRRSAEIPGDLRRHVVRGYHTAPRSAEIPRRSAEIPGRSAEIPRDLRRSPAIGGDPPRSAEIPRDRRAQKKPGTKARFNCRGVLLLIAPKRGDNINLAGAVCHANLPIMHPGAMLG